MKDFLDFSGPRRYFVHKKFFGAAKGFLTGGVTGALGGFVTGGRGRSGGQPTVPLRGRAADDFRRARSLGVGRCPSGKRRVAGICVDIKAALPFGDPLFSAQSGAAVMGRYGAGVTPLVQMREHRECLPGMVLGTDLVCYNKGDIRNNERRWPKGRRPLGTPGEMAALSKAASFGRRMEGTVKRMQKIGVLKKPARRSVPRAPQKLLGSGSPSIINVE